LSGQFAKEGGQQSTLLTAQLAAGCYTECCIIEVIYLVTTYARGTAKVLHGHLPGPVPQLEMLQNCLYK